MVICEIFEGVSQVRIVHNFGIIGIVHSEEP